MKHKRQHHLKTVSAALLSAMSTGLAAADSVQQRGTEVLIKFDEPVVSTGVVENAWNNQLPEDVRGLNLFDITGDPAYKPTARWVDQDCLIITFAKGTSAATKYRLAFRPGVDQYLSGKKMPKPYFEMQAAEVQLSSESPLPGIPGGAVIVMSDNSDTREALAFSPSSPVRYEFREVLKRYPFQTGKVIPAKAEPTKAEHLSTRALAHLLQDLQKVGLKPGKEGLEAFTLQHVLPRCVTVTPCEPPDPTKTWALYAIADKGSGFAGKELYTYFHPWTDLPSAVSVRVVREQNVPQLQAYVGFGAPVAENAVEGIFRNMDICAGDAVATTAEDGKSKTLTIGDKTYTFRLLPLPQNRILPHYMQRISGIEGVEGVDFDVPYTSGFSMAIEGADALPATVDFVLKKGTAAMLGQEMTTDHRHRLTLTPTAPVLQFDNTPLNPVLLPANGVHQLRLECINNSAMSVRLAALTPEQFAQYEPLFKKVNESAAKAYAEQNYRLHVLEKRVAAGIVPKNTVKETLNSYRRNLQRLRKEIPNYDALRAQMSNVSFSAPQLHNTTGQGIGALHSAELTVDLDALNGGTAGPGYYLVCVQSTASPNVQALLQEAGMAADSFNFEQWYAVQLTDLHMVEVGNALVLNSVSTGIPTAAAELLSMQDGETTAAGELKDGIVILPAEKTTRRNRTQYMVKCGNDFRLSERRNTRTRMNADRRIMVLKDRSMYRPGDTVHLRGVLREVSALGEPSMPHAKSAELIVSRPNRKELMRKRVNLNDYGAFDFEFKLPEGDEDIVGSYRISIQADGNKYRAEEFVECQEFRRDAFSAKAELKAASVLPEEFSCTVSAEDLNGVPLSGAKAELTFRLQPYCETPNIKGEKLPEPYLPTKEWKETLTLDAEGKATYTHKLPYQYRDMPLCGNCNLQVLGHVSNDREETMRLPHQGHVIYPADFYADFGGLSTLTLHSAEPDAEGNHPILQRDQAVTLRMITHKTQETTLPNGVVLINLQPVTLWQGELTVPANSVNGVETGLQQVWENYQNTHPEENADYGNTQAAIELRAKDSAGREMVQWMPLYRWMIHNRERRENRPATCKAEGRTLKVQANFKHAGRAVVIVNTVAGMRSAAPVDVQQGENTWEIPLLDAEYGTVNLCMMLPVENEGRYTDLEQAEGFVNVERVQNKLGVELTMPQPHPQPGAEVTLNGRILGPDGKPLPAAQVTLFAVDKGMLSVSGGHSVANPGTYFTTVWVQNLYPQFARTPAPMLPRTGANDAYPVIPGIWQGDMVGQGKTWDGEYNPASAALKHAADSWGGDDDACYGVPYDDCDADTMVERAAPVACEAAASPQAANGIVTGGVRSGSGVLAAKKARQSNRAEALAAVDTAWAVETGAPEPRLRTNFVPVAFWQPAVCTDAEGKFSVTATLPDTLTTYQVYAIALAADGKCFGYAENEFTVNQPVMITPGTPLFMSVGDRLRLPLTITNNTATDGTWTVCLSGADAPQQITLKAKSTSTLYFDYTAAEEGKRTLRWEARATAGSDAVEGSFEVKFPAPVLREAHRLVLQEGAEPLKVGTLPAAELATSTRGQVEVQLSANPLLHLNECMELTLNQGYYNTEWFATNLLPWMLHERMAPFSPTMASIPAAEARATVQKGIARLVESQCADGGMSYWPASDFYTAKTSSPWASAYAGLVLTIAADNGYTVPDTTLPRLRKYLTQYLANMRKDPEVWAAMSAHVLYAAGRTLQDDALVTEALKRAIAQQTARDGGENVIAITYHPRACCFAWFRSHRAMASLNFLAEMHADKEARHASFLKWLRSVGHDYRHATTWDGGWMLIALHEYLRLTPAGNAEATVALESGQRLTLGNGITAITPEKTPTLGQLPTTISPTAGTTYVSVKFKAQPEQTEYPGVTEKGLQVTRIYEKRGEDGAWRPATEFNVGDVVRVTLTCAKADKDLEYFVLEDYLPSNLEAINPKVRSQSAGLEWQPWSHWFDNREFQAHRVRGFCTRWAGRDLLNMSYYARVKRAGEAMAPPASAQLFYEPQTYGLSPNTKVISK